MLAFVALATFVALTIPLTIRAGGPWAGPLVLLVFLWSWYVGRGRFSPRPARQWPAMASLLWSAYYLGFFIVARVTGMDPVAVVERSEFLVLAGIPANLVIGLIGHRIHARLASSAPSLN